MNTRNFFRFGAVVAIGLGVWQGQRPELLARSNDAVQAAVGSSARCGALALGHLAQALGVDAQVTQRLLESPAPEGGFSLAELQALAQANGMSLSAVRRPTGSGIPVPCVIHWKFNHYSDVVEAKGDSYRLADPVLGGDVWVKWETIESRGSGTLLVPDAVAPATWLRLTAAECASIRGGVVVPGYYAPDDQGPPPDNCGDGDDQDADCDPPSANDGAAEGSGEPPPPPCACDMGMPTWQVSEPYITLWLTDRPLAYQTSNGKPMALKLSYKHRGLDRGASACGFGPNWECNWLGGLQFTSTNSTQAVCYLAGGGCRPFSRAGTPEYKTGRYLATGTAGLPQIVSTRGAVNHYDYPTAVQVGTPTQHWVTNYFLNKRMDRYGRAVHYDYETSAGIPRLASVLDVDGRTNTLTYGNASFPNLITAVTDPYGRSAQFTYDEQGRLTNIVDMAGMASSFRYGSSNFITNMTTLYGETGFACVEPTNSAGIITNRALLVTEASGDQQIFAFCSAVPGLGGGWGATSNLSFHWNRSQYAAITDQGKTNVLNMPAGDYEKAPVKQWLLRSENNDMLLSDSLEAMAGPYDPVQQARPGSVSYTYQGHTSGSPAGTLKRVTSVSRDGTLQLEITRSDLGRPTVLTYHNSDSTTATYNNTFDSTGRYLQSQTGPRDELLRGYGYHPTIPSLLTSVTNAVGDVLRYTHNTNTFKVTSVTFPSGLVRTNLYFSSGPSQGFLQTQIDIGVRTNAFAYDKGNLIVQTNELGLVTTNTWDSLNRLTNTAFPDGTSVAKVYDKLDLVGVKDRLDHWTHYGFDAVRQLRSETNANSQVTTYDYCGCGAPSQITRWDGARAVPTSFDYDTAGRLTNTTYADGYRVNRAYDAENRLQSVSDSGGQRLQLDYATVGLQDKVVHAFLGPDQYNQRLLFAQQFDEYGSVITNIDRNGVVVTNGYDGLHRLTARRAIGASGQQQSGLETFAYNARGLTNYFDPLGHPATFVRDAAGRVLFQTNANQEVLRFTYTPADDLQTLTDGKNQTTRWNYDTYGRVTNKVDATGTEIFRYAYDPNDRLTNRWTAAKGNTGYVHDNIGNLLSINYPQSSISYGHDGLNRLQTMVDATGTNSFTWTDGDQLASETGPWPASTASYTYNNRLRSLLSLQQPGASDWTQSYLYDEFGGLTNTTSVAGSFGYQYAQIYSSSAGQYTASDLLQELDLPTGAYSRRTFDDLGRLAQIALTNAAGSVLDLHGYAYDAGSQRTQQVFTAGNCMGYTYDPIAQLKTAKGREQNGSSRLHEQFGYAYDAAWNLNYRTNNALIETFTTDALNQLTNVSRNGTLTVAGVVSTGATSVTVKDNTNSATSAALYGDGTFAQSGVPLLNDGNTFTAIAQDASNRYATNTITANLPATLTLVYDANGNLTGDGQRYLAYDDENQLISVTVSNVWRSEFGYDGLMRRRIRREYTWQNGDWVKTDEVHYVYDRHLVVQERDSNNMARVTYTRGNDLNGALQAAGGIGGLLARTENRLPPGYSNAHGYYHADGNGNITCLVNTNNVVVASYTYDPFGGILTLSGPLAEVNLYRSSSKECHPASGLIYYLCRYYDPNSQRWLSRDPIGELGGWNLLRFSFNDPLNEIDPLGLSSYPPTPPPPPSLPGGPWTWCPNPQDRRWGTFRNDKGESVNWDPKDYHWDKKLAGGGTQRYNRHGAPLTPQQAHSPARPTRALSFRGGREAGVAALESLEFQSILGVLLILGDMLEPWWDHHFLHMPPPTDASTPQLKNTNMCGA